MKYFVVMINKDNKTFYKKNMRTEGWSTDKSECWAFSKNGAKNVAMSLSANSNNENVYNFIPSYGKGLNE